MNLTLTDCIAILGAATGVLALVVNFLTYWNKRANLEIKLPKIAKNSIAYFFNKSILFEQDKFSESHRALFQIDLNNNSDAPITIFEYHLIYNEKVIATCTQYLSNINSCKFAIDKQNATTIPIQSSNVFPLLTLKQYEYKRGFLMFVFNPPFNMVEETINFKIIVLTSRGNFSTSYIKCTKIDDKNMKKQTKEALNAVIESTKYI